MSILITDLHNGTSRVTITVRNNRFEFYINTDIARNIVQVIHSILMLIPDCRPGARMNELTISHQRQQCSIIISQVDDGNFITFIRGGEQSVIDERRLAQMLGIYFVDYQSSGGRVQVCVVDYNGEMLSIQDGGIGELERLFEISRRFATLLMTLYVRICKYPTNFRFDQYILFDINHNYIPFDMTHAGMVISGDAEYTIEDFIRMYE